MRTGPVRRTCFQKAPILRIFSLRARRQGHSILRKFWDVCAEGDLVGAFTMDRDHMSEGSSVSIGVVGLGYWGPNLLRGLVELPDVDVRYICDVSDERLGSLARRYAGATPTSCYEDL